MQTHHFQRPPQHATKEITIPQLLLRTPIIRQLDEICQRVLLEHQHETLAIILPPAHQRRHVHEDFEPHLADDLGRLAEIRAGARVGFREEVLDQPQPDVVAEAVELGVDGRVVGLVRRVGQREVAAELRDDGAVGQGDDFGVDFVDPVSRLRCMSFLFLWRTIEVVS